MVSLGGEDQFVELGSGESAMRALLTWLGKADVKGLSRNGFGVVCWECVG